MNADHDARQPQGSHDQSSETRRRPAFGAGASVSRAAPPKPVEQTAQGTSTPSPSAVDPGRSRQESAGQERSSLGVKGAGGGGWGGGLRERIQKAQEQEAAQRQAAKTDLPGLGDTVRSGGSTITPLDTPPPLLHPRFGPQWRPFSDDFQARDLRSEHCSVAGYSNWTLFSEPQANRASVRHLLAQRASIGTGVNAFQCIASLNGIFLSEQHWPKSMIISDKSQVSPDGQFQVQIELGGQAEKGTGKDGHGQHLLSAYGGISAMDATVARKIDAVLHLYKESGRRRASEDNSSVQASQERSATSAQTSETSTPGRKSPVSIGDSSRRGRDSNLMESVGRVFDGTAQVASSSTSHAIDETTPVRINDEQATAAAPGEPRKSAPVEDATPVRIDGEQAEAKAATTDDGSQESVGTVVEEAESVPMEEATPVNVDGEQAQGTATKVRGGSEQT